MNRLTLPYPPLLNKLYIRAKHGVVLSERARAFKQEVYYMAKQQGAEIIEGPVRVRMDVYRPRKAGDIDSTLKITLDALNGIAWLDDSQIVELTVRRYDDKHDPRLRVTIEEAE